MEVIDGKIIQKNFFKEFQKTISLLGLTPTVAIISTGDDKAQKLYFKQIVKMTQQLGIQLKNYHYEYVSNKTILNLMDHLNQDKMIQGILVLSPLIEGLNERGIRNRIDVSKDIEGLNEQNILKGKYNLSHFIPCTALGIIMLLNYYNINIEGKHIVILNRSSRIGRPLFDYFINHHATVTVCHSKTLNVVDLVKSADIVISGVGKPQFIRTSFFKAGSIVIDVGMSFLENKIVGDIQCDKMDHLKYYVPPIGGVGPMTITALAQNILISCFLGSEDKLLL